VRKCVFFDRDGVVNRSPGDGYVTRWEDFEILPEFVACLAEARRLGFEAVIVTNQKCVAKGIVTVATLEEMHRRLLRTLERQHGLSLLDILYCPHEDGACACRKPQPGMLLEAARKHGIDLARSWMIGDNERDVEAGRRAGCRTILVAGEAAESAADFRVASMGELTGRLTDILTGREKSGKSAKAKGKAGR
jgi:histidinol-phosphate phosphatase family protein